ncbi:hypothetical protein J3F84DRAFT_15648 [Trichoderma pleuroticola]
MALVGQVIRSFHFGFPLRRTATTQMRADKSMGDGVAPPPNHCRQSAVISPTPMLALHILECAVIGLAVRPFWKC